MRILFATLLCLLTITVQAEGIRGIFYQPQQSDLAIPLEQWPKIFSAAKNKGFNTLVIQWTSFGDVFASPKNQAWLKDRIIDASQADLKLIVGLSGDPEIFTRLKQPPTIVGSYFRKMNQANVGLATLWAKTLPAGTVSGWYLPLEVDDRQWRAIPAREELTKYLVRQVNDLNKVLPLPVYISSFFAGNMSPERYAAMLENIQTQSNIHFWIQDGSGTNKLISTERDLYLTAVSNCAGYAASGFIYELFQQTHPDQVFAAKSLNPLEMNKTLQSKSPCNGDNLFFALNYLMDFNTLK
ncbi:DUF4434 domain-containing protein [Polynucleobacter sp. AM-25C3]|jgi:hypothetical protein|uniref:DUF4434 domain-containing protein n=1 Tax=Polynucleobacter sp. AM-25C3 TaxID=1855569 RepID=UPI001C0CEC2B|nr:DUF4434 domain-containing protein [Polynucleobacter sp. AM-25C3]MBU3602702.1 DUF4434 domain-containing protein [Polynucleobacter sp. AM-25C3]